MLADTNERPGVEERYEVATNTSRLLLEEHRTGAADVLIAAGLSESRLGLALLRLHSEWSSSAKPPRPNDRQIQTMAASFKAQDETERANRARENGELDRLRGLLARTQAGAPGHFDLLVEIMKQERLYAEGKLPKAAPTPQGSPGSRARTEAMAWYRRELRLLAQSLKTRGVVIEQLTAWALIKGLDPAAVGPAVHHWLAPCCPVCDGLGQRKVPDAPALSGKLCHACNGTGNAYPPQGSGRLLTHIDYVVQVARQSLKRRLRNT
jgi:hypothetical protein